MTSPLARKLTLTALAVASVAATLLALNGSAFGDQERRKAETVEVQRFDALYYHVAEDFPDLARKAVAVVRARALDSQQEPGEDPDLVYTHQRFETLETYAGTMDAEFTVFLTGGMIHPHDGDPYLLSDPENPQYEQGKEYFLVLAQHPILSSEFVAIGPSQGRYEITDGRLVALPGSLQFGIEGRLHGKTVAEAAKMLRDARSQRPR